VAVVGGGDRDVTTVREVAVGEGGRGDDATEAAAAVLQVAAGVGLGGQPQLEADGGLDVALDAAVLGVGAGRGDDGRRGDVRGGAREGEPADQVAAGGGGPDGGVRRGGGGRRAESGRGEEECDDGGEDPDCAHSGPVPLGCPVLVRFADRS
jgi:hypothetical protein